MALTKVSTDGVKDDAITKTKIPANQIEASELADNAVDTNAIADQAVALSKLPHGTSSNDGKFLRANNGADPTFETITIPVGIPSGGIIIWSGAANAIPSGYVLCDGTNSTPDLRDRFVVGAQNAYAVGATGGATTDSVSISISGSTGVESVFGSNGYIQPSPHSGRPQHNHSFSGSGSATVDTLPPYYALCYIMKT